MQLTSPKSYGPVTFVDSDTVSMDDNDDPVGGETVLIELDDFDEELVNGTI